ncbi:MAG: 2-hydroxyacid dehydrogenase [Trueperaceae bacterium]
MSKEWHVAWLDVWDQRAQEAVLAVAPPSLNVTFAETYELEEQFEITANCDVIAAGWPAVTRELITNAASLKLIHKLGVGYDKIDLNAAKESRLAVAITSGANASAVAEHTVGLVLAALRRTPYVDSSLRSGRWLKTEMRVVNQQLRGKRVGLLGFGNIGRQVARKLAGFEVEIVYFDVRRADLTAETSLGAGYVSFDELLETSDILSLHVPLDESTRGILADESFARMKDGAVIINTSRGGIIDEQALVRCLKSGKIEAAGLDTFAQEPPAVADPLFTFPQVVLSPHIAGAVFDNVQNLGAHLFRNVISYLENGILPAEDTILLGVPDEG